MNTNMKLHFSNYKYLPYMPIYGSQFYYKNSAPKSFFKL